jgi:hypothetical protein
MAKTPKRHGKVKGLGGKVEQVAPHEFGLNIQSQPRAMRPRRPWTAAEMDALARTTPSDIAPMLQTRTPEMRQLLTAPERVDFRE